MTARPASLPVIQLSGAQLQITFLLAAPDLTYIVEASTDLVEWTPISTNAGIAGQMVTVDDTAAPANAPKRFLRLRVLRTEWHQ